MDNPTPKDTPNIYKPIQYPIIKKTYLNRNIENPSLDFFSVLKSRRTDRLFKELSLDQISALLWNSAKVISLDLADDFILTFRPTPSAGARHPIDLFIATHIDIENLSIQYYNPVDHTLNKLECDPSILEEFFIHVNQIVAINKATLVWFVAHPERTSAKYKNPESLIWRDAGALIYCIQLNCTALGISCCPIGSLGEPFVSKLFISHGHVHGAGGCLIG